MWCRYCVAEQSKSDVEESFDTPQAAKAREYQIKRMSRKKKLDLIASREKHGL